MDSRSRVIAGILFFLSLAFFAGSHTPVKKNYVTDDQLLKKLMIEKPFSETRTPASESFEKSALEIEKTHQCYQSQTCDFSQADPRAYDFAVGKKLAEQIRDYKNQFSKTPKAQPSLEKISRDYFQSSDGFVQEAALEILQELPLSEQNLQALLNGLRFTADPLIMEQSLPYLARYIGTPWENQMQKGLEEGLQGAHYVAKTLSENLLPFITDSSYQSYRTLLAQLKPNTLAYKNLLSALREFEKRQSGG